MSTYAAGSGYKAAKKLRSKMLALAAKIVILEDRVKDLEKENKSLKQNIIFNFKVHKREVAELEQHQKQEVADLEQRLSEAQSTLSNLEQALSFGALEEESLICPAPGPLWTLLATGS